MKQTVKKCFQNLWFSTGLIVRASKKYFILNLMSSILAGLVPYLPMLLLKELQNRLLEYPKIGKPQEILLLIAALTAGYVIAMLLEKLIGLVIQFTNYRYTDAMSYYLDHYIVDKVSGMKLAFYDSSTLHNTLKNVSKHLRLSTEGMVNTVFEFVNSVVKLVLALVMIATLDLWMIPIIILLIIPSILQRKYSQKAEYTFEKEHGQAERKIEYYKELFLWIGREELRLYQAQDYFLALYEKNWKEWKEARIKLKVKNQVFWLSQFLSLTVIELFAYGFALVRLAAKTIGVGDVVYYVSMANQVRDSFVGLFYELVRFFQRSIEVDDIRAFMQMQSIMETGGSKIPSAHPRVEFRKVAFRYPDADTDVLRDCSFVIEPKEKLGLVGLNGAGKSTIVKLLCRFYDPTEGQILIDGVDVKEYDIVKLRERFGVLFQDYVNYSFSLRENVALSDISRKGEDAAILAACERSGVSEFMGDWEDGLDTNMTRQFEPEGKELSGGQWQRVSLARAFFRDAPIVLLDEPSAALDPVAEHEIFEDFAKVSEGKSAVLISHRLSSITLCDKILVLENGRIIEQGSHQELLKQNGRYAYLFNLQASKYMY